MYKVDLNSDLGESFGNYTIGNDDKVIPLITSANVACGYHASDPVVMDKTLGMAKEAGIRVGAHPGLPDLMGFGRRNLSVSPDEAKAYVLYQLGALEAFCRVHHMKMQHVKPHGALYNMAAKDYELSLAICQGIKDFDPELIVLALSGGELARAAKDLGLRTALEVFADRAYEEDGSLVNRRKEGAMITDEELAVFPCSADGKREKGYGNYRKGYSYSGRFCVRSRRRGQGPCVCGKNPQSSDR